MKYELKGIKYAAFASEETSCYQAGIYRGGRKVGEVSNQTDSGQNKLGPSDTRWADRSVTYEGIAMAMATQWTR